MGIMKQCQSMTMSGVDIAELCEKRHDHVMRDVRKMLDELELPTPQFSGVYLADNGQEYECFNLPRRECDILVSGYSIKYRAAIVDRWQELESKQVVSLPDFTNPAEAARAWADEVEAKQKALELIEQQAPKVSFVDNLVERGTLMTATQVAQKHGMSAIKLNKVLDEIGGVYSKAVKRSRTFLQSLVDAGYGELKQTELGHSQALFTPAGEARVHEMLISDGVM